MPPVLAVALGGIVGTALRIALDALIPHTDTSFPWSTLLINIVGSFALGLLVARVWPIAPAWARAGLGAGLMGSFTTFSAFAVSLVTLSRAGMTGLALVYLVASVVAGLAAAWLGLRFGRRPEPLEKNE
jgi:fluoride exporter